MQLGTNKMGEWARQLGGTRPGTAGGCIAAMIVFGLFCHESLRLAWADAEARGLVESNLLTSALLFVLPYAEPFAFWVKRQLFEVKTSAPTRLWGRVAAAAAFAAATPAAAQQPAAIPQHQPERSADEPMISLFKRKITAQEYRARQDKARELLRARKHSASELRSDDAIARHVGLPRDLVRKLRQEVDAQKRAEALI